MSVRLDDHDGTAVITLDRPPLNALDLPTIGALTARIAHLASHPPQRGVVFTGAGRAFTAGVDTRFVASASAADRAAMVLAINRTAGVLYALPFPVVAAFNGHAIGAGIVIGLACDRRVAARGAARFGLAEVTAGIPYPAVPMEIVRDALPEPHRSRLVLGGESVDVHGALTAGMVDEIVEPEQLLPRALAVARELATARAFTMVKRQLRAPVAARIESILASGTDPLLATIAAG